MSTCPNCKSDAVTPLNPPEDTIFECVKCRTRYHINGITVTDILAEGHPQGRWGELEMTMNIAKAQAEANGWTR